MKITPTDLRKKAQTLVESGQMPSLDQLLQAVFEARRKYVPRILAARAETQPQEFLTLSQSDVRKEAPQFKNERSENAKHAEGYFAVDR